ncbi:MAG: hypothetical protein JSR53_00350 [Proteobacteria bacterium]|nr:hypothetical protein [Pseudomonadota bacterium]
MGTIASCQAAIAFTHAHERDGCGNCKHVQRLPLQPGQRYEKLQCGRYGFWVRAADTCMHYAPTPAPAPAATALPTIEGGCA